MRLPSFGQWMMAVEFADIGGEAGEVATGLPLDLGGDATEAFRLGKEERGIEQGDLRGPPKQASGS